MTPVLFVRLFVFLKLAIRDLKVVSVYLLTISEVSNVKFQEFQISFCGLQIFERQSSLVTSLLGYHKGLK